MNVRLHHGAVNADLVAIVDLGSDRVLDEEHVDPLQRDRLDLLDVALQRLLVGDGVPNVEATECSIADRVGEVERELIVAEPADLLHHDHTQHLLPGHSFSTALLTDLVAIVSNEILMHPLRCCGVRVEDPADRFELARMGVVVERGDESELLRHDASHAWAPSAPAIFRSKSSGAVLY